MTGLLSTAGIARRSARRPWIVVIAWVVVLAIAIVAATQMQIASTGTFTNNVESQTAMNLIEERLRSDAPITETVIIRSETDVIDSSAFQSHVGTVAAELGALDEVVTNVVNYYDLAAADFPGIETMVSEDQSALLMQIEMGTNIESASEHARTYLDTVSRLNTGGFQVLSVGDVSAYEEFSTIAGDDLGNAQNYGLPAALVVLVVVFGALIAAGIPLAIGLVTVAVAIGLAAGVSQFFELDFFITNMIAMIGLAVGIDYSLFIIERYREERRSGIDELDAISVAGATASKAVVFSGLTTALALVGLFLLPVTTFQSLAIGAILAVAVAVLAALTLIPAALGLLGDRINWPRLRRGTQADNDPATPRYTGIWARITHAVMRRPVISMALAVAILLAATAPVLDLNTGQSGIESLPESDIKTAYEVLREEFYVGTLSPVEIVIDGNTQDPAVMVAADRLIETLGQNPNYGVATIEVSENRDLALISAPMKSDANSSQSYAAIEELRSELIPITFTDVQATILVSGQTAFMEDFNGVLSTYMPIVFAFVLGLSFIVLMVAFRSIVIPFMSIFMNLLSVGAAYGMLVLAFQKGYGDFLGLTHTPIIEAWIPIFLFCILFGLSMDYHFFLLSRIREHFDLTGNNDEAVAVGLQRTGKIITGAALIMVVVFGAFAAGRLVDLQQLGFGLAVSVFLDATVVRSVLVPSLMKLLGKYNWYLPAWLSWMPNIAIEGKRPELGGVMPDVELAPAVGDD
jgi:putative drug exporter of the RND superfamily